MLLGLCDFAWGTEYTVADLHFGAGAAPRAGTLRAPGGRGLLSHGRLRLCARLKRREPLLDQRCLGEALDAALPMQLGGASGQEAPAAELVREPLVGYALRAKRRPAGVPLAAAHVPCHVITSMYYN